MRLTRKTYLIYYIYGISRRISIHYCMQIVTQAERNIGCVFYLFIFQSPVIE